LPVQTQSEKVVVVFNYVSQRRKSAIVIEAALLMCPETLQRRRSVSSIRGAIRLKIINADFSRCVHIPAGLREQRRDVTRGAFRFFVEYQFSIFDGGRNSRWACEDLARRSGGRWVNSSWCCGRWNGQLIKMESSKLRSN